MFSRNVVIIKYCDDRAEKYYSAYIVCHNENYDKLCAWLFDDDFLACYCPDFNQDNSVGDTFSQAKDEIESKQLFMVELRKSIKMFLKESRQGTI